MSENKLDGLLSELAADYRQPPSTPREEIWSGIEAAREKGTARGEGPVMSPLRRRYRRIWPGLAAAAVLALGIAIGRYTRVPAETQTLTTAASEEIALDPGPYRFATVQHLGRAEALLTLFRSEARAGEVTGQLEDRARELLATTRLLMDSPSSEDPELRRLLDDVELLLVQITQLAGDRRAEEVALIEDGIQRRDVMLRLRSLDQTDARDRATVGAL